MTCGIVLWLHNGGIPILSWCCCMMHPRRAIHLIIKMQTSRRLQFWYKVEYILDTNHDYTLQALPPLSPPTCPTAFWLRQFPLSLLDNNIVISHNICIILSLYLLRLANKINLQLSGDAGTPNVCPSSVNQHSNRLVPTSTFPSHFECLHPIWVW